VEEERRWQSQRKADHEKRAASVWGRAAAAVSLVLLNLLVLDTAVETWRSSSPLKGWVALATAVYLAAVLWALSQGARPAVRGWLAQPPAPLLFFLGLLVATTSMTDGMTNGLRLLGQPTPTVLLATMLGLVVLAGLRLITANRLTAWIKLIFGVACVYAATAFVMAFRVHTPLTEVLAGRSLWVVLPWWLRGGFLGALVLVPLALAAEILTAMARLVLGMRLWWILIFGLGAWIAIIARGG
jgi:hypothetical protein